MSGPHTMSGSGQNAKYSARANDFPFAPVNQHHRGQTPTSEKCRELTPKLLGDTVARGMHRRRTFARCVMVRLPLLALVCILAPGGPILAEAGPVFSSTGFDAETYGASEGYPVPSLELRPGTQQEFMVGFYSHYDKV